MSAHDLSHGLYEPSWLVGHIRQNSKLILLGLGILAAFAHATFRFPLHLPGHHGLEWMALPVIARKLSHYRWAAGVAASGAAAASLLPVLGFHDPLTPLFYLVPALALDMLCHAAPPRWRRATLFLGVAAAHAFAAKPILQWPARRHSACRAAA